MVRLRPLLLLSTSVLVVVATYQGCQPASVVQGKSVEAYWAETGLEPKALEDVVDDESCGSSQRYFLACANALGAVASRLGLKMTFDGSFKKVPATSDFSEKAMLEPWRKFFAEDNEQAVRLSFRKTWRNLVETRIPESRRPMMTGLALNGFLSVFRDPHTYILPVNYYEEVVSRMNASSSALGVVLARGRNAYYLRKVMEGSPSFHAGLRRGDWILEVNGVELHQMPPQRLGEVFKAENGGLTRLKVQRDDRLMTVEIPRKVTEVPSVTWRLLDGVRPVGLLTINKFARDSCRVVKDSLIAMNEARLRGLLLDVRDNTGGQMDEAACILSLFIGSDKTAFRVKYMDPAKDPETYFGEESKIWRGRMAVLINAGSASAAEMVAGSLRDHRRAVLVGERSFGKGSFQEGELWSRNRKLAFFQTKGFYYLPSGESPQLRGILPDVAINDREAMSLREEDQYAHPLNPPTLASAPRSRALDLSACLEIEDGNADDPQLARARTALSCAGITAEATRGAL